MARPRDSVLIIRIAASLHDVLKNTARRSNRTVSELTRDIIIDAMAGTVVRGAQQLESR
jgi:hypothetical protein